MHIVVNSDDKPLTDFYNTRRKRSTEGEYSLSFLIDRTERNATVFDQIVNKTIVQLDGENFITDEVNREPDGNGVVKEVDARHEMFDRLKSVTVKESYTAQKQLSAWLDIVLKGSGLTYEIVGNFPSEQFENFGMDNGQELFKTLIERFGVEYRPYGTHILIAESIGEVTEAQFRHGHNLKTFSDTFNTDDVVTRVIGYGKADEDTGKPLISVTVESPNINAYDRVYEYVFQDERFTDIAALTEYAKTFLNDGTYSAKVEYEELKKNGLNLHNFDVGDYVYVIYELNGMDIDLQARIMSIEDDPFDPTFSPVLEIGSFQRDITRTVSGLQSTSKRVTQLEGSVATVRQTATKASEDANKALQDTGNYSQTLTQHINNTVIHVTDEDRQRWDTAAEEAGTAPTKESIGLGNVDNVKQAAKTDFDLHVQDLTAHWTQEQRDQLQGILDDYGRRIAALEDATLPNG